MRGLIVGVSIAAGFFARGTCALPMSLTLPELPIARWRNLHRPPGAAIPEALSHFLVRCPGMAGEPMAGCRGPPREDRAMAAFDRTAFAARRRLLDRSVRRDAAASGAQWSRSVLEIAAARHLAAYVPVAGELDPGPIIARCRAGGAQVYLPVPTHDDDAGSTLIFAEHRTDDALIAGAYAIPVPPPDAPRIAAMALDVVLVPLIAFDDRGTRVGMGAGFYDRAFAFRGEALTPPLLVGLAYRWQQVGMLRREAWDVGLDVVITDRGVLRMG